MLLLLVLLVLVLVLLVLVLVLVQVKRAGAPSAGQPIVTRLHARLGHLLPSTGDWLQQRREGCGCRAGKGVASRCEEESQQLLIRSRTARGPERAAAGG